MWCAQGKAELMTTNEKTAGVEMKSEREFLEEAAQHLSAAAVALYKAREKNRISATPYHVEAQVSVLYLAVRGMISVTGGA